MIVAVLGGTLASLQAAIVSSGRISFAMGRDRVFPQVLRQRAPAVPHAVERHHPARPAEHRLPVGHDALLEHRQRPQQHRQHARPDGGDLLLPHGLHGDLVLPPGDHQERAGNLILGGILPGIGAAFMAVRHHLLAGHRAAQRDQHHRSGSGSRCSAWCCRSSPRASGTRSSTTDPSTSFGDQVEADLRQAPSRRAGRPRVREPAATLYVGLDLGTSEPQGGGAGRGRRDRSPAPAPATRRAPRAGARGAGHRRLAAAVERPWWRSSATRPRPGAGPPSACPA